MSSIHQYPFYFFGHGNTYNQYQIAIVFRSPIESQQKEQIKAALPDALKHKIIWHTFGLVAFGLSDYEFPIDYANLQIKCAVNKMFEKKFKKEIELVLSTLPQAQQCDEFKISVDEYESLLEKVFHVPDGMDLFKDSNLNGRSLDDLEYECRDIGFYSFFCPSDEERKQFKEKLTQTLKVLHQSLPIFYVYTPEDPLAEPELNKTDWDQWSESYFLKEVKPNLIEIVENLKKQNKLESNYAADFLNYLVCTLEKNKFENDPEDKHSLSILANSCYQEKLYEEAIIYLEKYLEIVKSGDSLSKYQHMLGDCYCIKAEKALESEGGGDLEQAALYYEKAMSLATLIPELAHFDGPWVGRGHVAILMKEYEKALPYYDIALERNPNSAYAWSGKAAALADLHQYKTALSCLKKARECDANYWHTYYCEACIFALKKDFSRKDEILTLLEKSASLYPKLNEVIANDSAFDWLKEEERFKGMLEG